MREKFEEVEEKDKRVADLLEGERQALWTIIKASIRYQMESLLPQRRWWLVRCVGGLA